MAQTAAPPPPRKWPYRGIIACGTFVTFAAAIMALVDFGSFVDGPGAGYLGSNGSSSFGLFAVSGLSFVVTLVLVVRWPFARWFGIGAGVVAFVVFLFGGAPVAIMRVAWARACVRGDDRACGASLNVLADTDPRLTGFAERACRYGDPNACARWRAVDSVGACRSIGDSCAVCEKHPLDKCEVPASVCSEMTFWCSSRRFRSPSP